MFKKKLISSSLVAIMCLGLATGTLANENDTQSSQNLNVSVKSGGLHIETPSTATFGDITIKENAEQYKTDLGDVVKVKDLRGSVEGWNLKVSATPFNNGSHTLPIGSFSLDAVKAIIDNGGILENKPTIELTKTSIIDDGEVLVANASEGKGAGVFDIEFDSGALGLTVDAKTAKTGEYVSTVTWTLEATPVVN